jgi:hypothetical protein
MRGVFRQAAVSVVLAALIAASAPPSSAAAATLEPIGRFDSPVYITSARGDPDRLFVVERGGDIELVTPSRTSTFITVPDVRERREQGLLSAAFAPNFHRTGRFYVFYTGTDNGALHLDEFTASGNAADPATRRPVLRIPHRRTGSHNAGQLQFGPDGYLYISTGDGGGSADPEDNAQDPSSRLGKLLRIDPRRTRDARYSVPTDNPFADSRRAHPEIWSLGLRNPWRFSFDRRTGSLLLTDVAEGGPEELNFEPRSIGLGRGDNFGWDCMQGSVPFTGCTGDFTYPIHEYPHDGGRCAITGGYVSRDPGVPELTGRYLYADHCLGELRSLIPRLPRAVDDRSEGLTVPNPTGFGEDSCGRLYVASFAGTVYRIEGDGPPGCARSTFVRRP